MRRLTMIDGYCRAQSDMPRSVNGEAPNAPPPARAIPGGRNTPFYLAHSYHTKVPPEAIEPFLRHFTKPGDVVLDPFAGSGMTGVAAAMSGRRAILNDLAAVSTHLAWNHTRPCDVPGLNEAFARIEAAVGGRIAELYSTTDEAGRPARIRWTVWSTRHECPRCRHTFALWDTIDRKTGRLGRSTKCPDCAHTADRRQFRVVSNSPAWVAFEREDGSLGEKPASKHDVGLGAGIKVDRGLWHPTTPLGPDREMYQRCALHLQGVRTVADLYTPRNMLALALLWREIMRIGDERLQRAMAFAFTNTAWHGTRMRRFNARGGHRPLTGTLYVPQLSSEANVLEVMRRKVKQLSAYYSAYAPQGVELPAIMLGSAAEMAGVASSSVDYVFTDPPFGSNIFYADCNVVWESWLGKITDPAHEAVINRSLSVREGGKSLAEYAAIMDASLEEIARVLKPGGWATIVFHNTDAAVWNALQRGAEKAGLEPHEASSLDRKQHSHKGYKGRDGEEAVAHYDVVMNLRKPHRNPLRRRPQPAYQPQKLTALIETVRAQPDMSERGLQGVHAEVIRRLVSSGCQDLPGFKDVREICQALDRDRRS